MEEKQTRMKLGKKWTIYWMDYMADSYVYGSKVKFVDRNEVQFENILMPPGSEIKTWFSKTNYQMQRVEPSLPIIDGEGEYIITKDIETKRGEQLFLKIVFYDKYDVEVGQLIVREDEKVFRCPMATYSYKIKLINGGATKFVFHSIGIQEVLDGAESNNKKTK